MSEELDKFLPGPKKNIESVEDQTVVKPRKRHWDRSSGSGEDQGGDVVDDDADGGAQSIALSSSEVKKDKEEDEAEDGKPGSKSFSFFDSVEVSDVSIERTPAKKASKKVSKETTMTRSSTTGERRKGARRSSRLSSTPSNLVDLVSDDGEGENEDMDDEDNKDYVVEAKEEEDEEENEVMFAFVSDSSENELRYGRRGPVREVKQRKSLREVDSDEEEYAEIKETRKKPQRPRIVKEKSPSDECSDLDVEWDKINMGVDLVLGWRYVVDEDHPSSQLSQQQGGEKRKREKTEETDGREKEYFVKFRQLSHLHDEWIHERVIKKVSRAKWKNYEEREPEMCVSDRPLSEAWITCVRVIAQERDEVLILWGSLYYEDSTWELLEEMQDVAGEKEVKERNR